jgi:hypothetical protein
MRTLHIWDSRTLQQRPLTRRAAAAPAITLDDMLLLLDELAELTTPASGPGGLPAASPATAARTTGGVHAP